MSEAMQRAYDAFRAAFDTPAADLVAVPIQAFFDPHDSQLQNVILGAMGFVSNGPNNYSPMARVQAHDAIAALRAMSQGEHLP